MESKTLKKDMALRLELTIEIEARIKQRHDDEVNQLKQAITRLQNETHTLSKEYEELQSQSIPNKQHQELSERYECLDSDLKKLNTKYINLREQTSTIKSEHLKLKSMDPEGLKKNLDACKKKLKIKTQTVEMLTKDKSQLQTVIIKQNREITSFKALSEASKLDSLYESSCKSFQIMGTVFKSDSHPFVVNGMNYRVVNQMTGASYVAQWVDNTLAFSEEIDLPEDIIAYLERSIIENLI